MPFRDGTPTLDEIEAERAKIEAQDKIARESQPRLVFTTWFPKNDV